MLGELQLGEKVCLLKKSLYGLRQAGKCWYNRLDKALRKYGAISCKADPCVYRIGEGERLLIIAVYVDDMHIRCQAL